MNNKKYFFIKIGLTTQHPDWKNLYSLVIMCRSIFTPTPEDQIKESYDLLTPSGIMIMCEGTKSLTTDEGYNKLRPILSKYYQNINQICDETYTYFICKKNIEF